MHPVIRVAGLIALAVGLASAAATSLLLATGLLGIVAVSQSVSGPVFLEPPKRLKWLLVSVILLYAFLLPGTPVLAEWPALSPSRQGLAEGLSRCWMLVVMAGSARCLMVTTPREDIMGAIYWITRPLRVVGIDSSRFCLRLVLTLEYVFTFRSERESTDFGRRGKGFTERAAALARSRLAAAESKAAEASPGPVVIPRCGAPPWWQWAGPGGLLVGLLALSGTL